MGLCRLGVCALIVFYATPGLAEAERSSGPVSGPQDAAERALLADLAQIDPELSGPMPATDQVATLLLEYAASGDPRGVELARAVDALADWRGKRAESDAPSLVALYTDTLRAASALGEGPVKPEEVLEVVQYFGIGTNVVRAASRIIGFDGVETKQDCAQQLAARTNRDLAMGLSYRESLAGRIDRFADGLVDRAPPRARPLLGYDRRLQLIRSLQSVPPSPPEDTQRLERIFIDSGECLGAWESRAFQLLALRSRLHQITQALVTHALQPPHSMSCVSDGSSATERDSARASAALQPHAGPSVTAQERLPSDALGHVLDSLGSLLSAFVGTAAGVAAAVRAMRG